MTIEVNASVLPGHPEFWDLAYSMSPRFFNSAKRLEPLINEIFSVGPAEPLHKVCRYIAKTVCNSLGALIVLAVNGYGNDA